MFRLSSVLYAALKRSGLGPSELNSLYDKRTRKRIGPFRRDDEVLLRISDMTGMPVTYLCRRNRILLLEAGSKTFWYRKNGLRKVFIDCAAVIPNTALVGLASQPLCKLVDLGALSPFFSECKILGGTSYPTGYTSIHLDPQWISVEKSWEWAFD